LLNELFVLFVSGILCRCGRLDGHAADAVGVAYLSNDRVALSDTSSESSASPSISEYFDPLMTTHGSTGDAAVPLADHDTTEVVMCHGVKDGWMLCAVCSSVKKNNDLPNPHRPIVQCICLLFGVLHSQAICREDKSVK